MVWIALQIYLGQLYSDPLRKGSSKGGLFWMSLVQLSTCDMRKKLVWRTCTPNYKNFFFGSRTYVGPQSYQGTASISSLSLLKYLIHGRCL